MAGPQPSAGVIFDKHDTPMMLLLQQMFPNKSKLEINGALTGFMGMQDQLTKTIDVLMSQPPVADAANKALNVPGPSGATPQPGPSNPLIAFDSQLNQEQKRGFANILQIFPDVEPKWVIGKLREEGLDDDDLVRKMFDEPKYYDKIGKSEQKNTLNEMRRNKLMDPTLFDPDQFLKVYPDPVKTFSDIKTVKTNLYKDHARIAILKDFPGLRMDFVRKVLWRHGQGHLYPSYKEIKKFCNDWETKKPAVVTPLKIQRRKPKQFMAKTRPDPKWPDNIDEPFFRELQFVRWEDTILQYKRNLGEVRSRNLEAARAAGTLQDCEICVTGELLNEDMISCHNNHNYCIKCVSENVDTKLEGGCHKIECLAGECEEVYSTTNLGRILPATVFNRLVRNMQQYELREARMENLNSCPFCEFAVVIENENEKLFTCLNPDCLKVSCRACKEENHIPLRCDEIEQSDEVKMRTYIEERCADALIRKCPTCAKPIIKETGCNKMACPCGAYFCYVCNKLLERINPYAHFTDHGTAQNPTPGVTCAANTSMAELHEQVALKAGQEAREKYLKEHPQMTGKLEKRDIKVDKLVMDKPEAAALPPLAVAAIHPAPPPQLLQNGPLLQGPPAAPNNVLAPPLRLNLPVPQAPQNDPIPVTQNVPESPEIPPSRSGDPELQKREENLRKENDSSSSSSLSIKINITRL